MSDNEIHISLIAAVAENRVVGLEGEMPWHLSADLRYFRRMTEGKVVIMGRKTYESIGKPLPNRTNFIVTRRSDHAQFDPGCHLFHSVEEAMAAARAHAGATPEIMVIGGAQIYQATLPLATRLYLTEVHAAPEGDAFFPPLNISEWKQLSRQRYRADEKNVYDYSFVVWERKTSLQNTFSDTASPQEPLK